MCQSNQPPIARFNKHVPGSGSSFTAQDMDGGGELSFVFHPPFGGVPVCCGQKLSPKVREFSFPTKQYKAMIEALTAKKTIAILGDQKDSGKILDVDWTEAVS